VADRIYVLLKEPPRSADPAPVAPAADVTGQWDVRIEYAAGASSHALHLVQRGSRIEGSHQGDFVTRDLAGSIDGNAVRVASNYPESNGDALTYTFTGQATADEMSGTLEMGEYRAARWTAKRRVRGKA
jgi:hypothetical protein